MKRAVRSIGPWVVGAVWCLSPAPPSAAAPAEDPHSVIVRATSQAPDIPGQAETLVRLAWPTEGPRDPRVQAAARHELIDYGEFALRPLREAVKRLDPLWRADVVATFIEAARTITFGQPPDLLPGLEEAIWFGSSDARRLAIREVGRYQFPPAVLPILDAVGDNPELTVPAIRALGQMGDARARFFLGRVLVQGPRDEQREAAAALGRLGDGGLFVLRESARSTSRTEREAAFSALLSAARPEDADLFHRYVLQHPDDDPALLQRVRDRGTELENLLEQQRDADAASADQVGP